jgi:hypothetical protein
VLALEWNVDVAICRWHGGYAISSPKGVNRCCSVCGAGSVPGRVTLRHSRCDQGGIWVHIADVAHGKVGCAAAIMAEAHMDTLALPVNTPHAGRDILLRRPAQPILAIEIHGINTRLLPAGPSTQHDQRLIRGQQRFRKRITPVDAQSRTCDLNPAIHVVEEG